MSTSQPSLDEDQIGGIAGSAVGDQPTRADSLGFKPYVEAIAGFLLADATKPPITISIEGEWGSGKSSFLLQLEDAITGEPRFDALVKALPPWLGGESSSGSISEAWKKLRGPRPPLTVRFNAWRHDKQDSLWAAFALAFVQSLRSEIGFFRAYSGDVRLFIKRLHGAKAWFELALLAASVLFLIAAVIGLRYYVGHLSLDEIHALLDRLSESSQKTGTASNQGTLLQLALRGTWGAFAAIGVAGIVKFHKYFKFPLSIHLEKYISKPDYAGHVAFIENFHEDFERLIKAYAGRRRVFIFVDDLDRCDVPRAAELMQAINLMIGDAGNLVFILGMDREKVAAGVALKYKDLFPFLRESAQWKPGADKDDFTPLYFGYAYLEKFIQISFSLPVARDDSALNEFLQDRPILVATGWRSRFGQYWKRRLRPTRNAFTGFSVPDPKIAAKPAGEPAAKPEAEPPRIEYRRIEIKEDSDRTRKIVRMVSNLFENNPRRIKQFINTFRLALFIASDQGLFDRPKPSEPSAATPEQIGKFVAMLLRFPDLRYRLEEDPGFLAGLEDMALLSSGEHPDNVARWLGVKGARELLTCKVRPGEPDTIRNRYSLKSLGVTRLFSVLPRANRPPKPSAESRTDSQPKTNSDSEVLNDLMTFADTYDEILKTQPPGVARNNSMRNLFQQSVIVAARFTPEGRQSAIDLFLASYGQGGRLMRIAVAYAQYDRRDADWLLQMLEEFASPFEHQWCVQTLSLYVDRMSAAQKTQIVDTLTQQWERIQGENNRARLKEAELLREAAFRGQNPPSPAQGSTPESTQRSTPSSNLPLTSEIRSACEHLYAKIQAAIDITHDFDLLKLLHGSRLQIASLFSADLQYRLQADTALFESMLAEIEKTNDSLKALQTSIHKSSVAEKIAILGDVLAAIERVLSLLTSSETPAMPHP